MKNPLVARSLGVLVLATMSGIVIRVITGVIFTLASVPEGWSGIATFVVMYGVALAALWPQVPRWASALASVGLGAPIVVGVAAMPASGHAIDVASGALVFAVFSGVQVSMATSTARRGFRRLTRDTKWAERARDRRRRRRAALAAKRG